MRQIIEVKSNTIFWTPENQTEFSLNANLELVIVHLDGKDYKVSKEGFTPQLKVAEHRFFVDPETLQQLITGLQLAQKKLAAMEHNAHQINSLIKYVEEKPQPTPESKEASYEPR